MASHDLTIESAVAVTTRLEVFAPRLVSGNVTHQDVRILVGHAALRTRPDSRRHRDSTLIGIRPEKPTWMRELPVDHVRPREPTGRAAATRTEP